MVNKVFLVGRVGTEPELRTTQAGKSILKFRLATSESRKVDDKWEETTEWHSIVCFGKAAEATYGKGDMVFVEGKIHYGSYDKDGVTMYTTDIFPDRIRTLNRKSGDSPAPQQQSYSSPKKSKAADPWDEEQ